MKIECLAAIFVLLATPSLALAEDSTKVAGVCEVLTNLDEFGNSIVAIVGRLEVTGVIYDRRNYVSRMHVKHPVITENYVSPNRILISTTREKGLPKAPTGTPAWNRPLLIQKTWRVCEQRRFSASAMSSV